MRLPRSWRLAALVAFALAAAVAAALPRAREYARHGISVTIEDVGLPEEGARDRDLVGRVAEALRTAGAASTGGTLRARLWARNETVLPAWVREARYRVYARGREIGHGTWKPPAGTQLFWPGQEVPLVAAMDSQWPGMMGAGVDVLKRRDAVVSVEGEVEAGVPPFWFRVPFEVRRVSKRRGTDGARPTS